MKISFFPVSFFCFCFFFLFSRSSSSCLFFFEKNFSFSKKMASMASVQELLKAEQEARSIVEGARAGLFFFLFFVCFCFLSTPFFFSKSFFLEERKE